MRPDLLRCQSRLTAGFAFWQVERALRARPQPNAPGKRHGARVPPDARRALRRPGSEPPAQLFLETIVGVADDEEHDAEDDEAEDAPERLEGPHVHKEHAANGQAEE